jgi:pentapeptide MXKDX repeat protein
MKKVWIAACVLTFAAAAPVASLAQSPQQDKLMSRDNMSKDKMGSGSMKKEHRTQGMSRSHMKKGDMSKESMKKDDMK